MPTFNRRHLTTVFILAPVLWAGLCVCPAVSRADDSIHRLTVVQETERHNGVWVVRPRPVDRKVVDLIQLNRIRTLEDYAAWMAANLSYQKDLLEDRWTPPIEMLESKKGDCEDYAFLTAAVMNVLGFRPHFLALDRGTATHAICAFQKDGEFVWFDNAILRRTKAGSLKEFASYLTRRYRYARALELDLKTRRWNLITTAS